LKSVQLEVKAVALDWKGSPVVTLRERGGQRAIFIWVGIAEASAISMHLEGQQPPRPMTHDLIVLILGQLGVRIERVVITDVRSNTYYAHLHLQDGDRATAVDCRPSDAIAVALRAHAPIYIDEELLQRLDAEQKEQGAELSPGTTVADSGETTIH
jgi:bifunctional DNase/RNase